MLSNFIKCTVAIVLTISLVLRSNVSASPILSTFDMGAGARLNSVVQRSDGSVWYTLSGGRSLGSISHDGIISIYPLSGNSEPSDIIEGSDGAIWYTVGGRIGRTTTGHDHTLFDQAVANDVRHLTVGSDGAIWFTEFWNGKWSIGRINSAGEAKHFQLNGERGIIDITAGSDGALWFTEYLNDTDSAIGRLTLDGQYSAFVIPVRASYPHAITSGPDGALWFTQIGRGNVARLTTDKQFTEYNLPDGFRSGSAITTGPDGALWITSGSDYAIYRMTIFGTVDRFPLRNSGGGLTAIASDGKDGVWFTSYGITELDSYLGYLKLSTKPFIPDGLSVVSPTMKVILNWNRVENAVSYEIFRDGISIGITEETNYSDNNATDGSHAYSVKAISSHGVASDFSNEVSVLIDNETPRIAYNVNKTASQDGWHNSDITVSFDCSDSLSGIQNCSEPVTVSNEGASQVVKGSAVDKAGNLSTTSIKINLDKTAPSLLTPAWSSSSIQQGKSATLSITATDSLSGVKSVQYAVNREARQNMSLGNSTNTWSATLGSNLPVGTHTVVIIATDKAGNESQRTATLTVTKPSSSREVIKAVVTVIVQLVKSIISKLFAWF